MDYEEERENSHHKKRFGFAANLKQTKQLLMNVRDHVKKIGRASYQLLMTNYRKKNHVFNGNIPWKWNASADLSLKQSFGKKSWEKEMKMDTYQHGRKDEKKTNQNMASNWPQSKWESEKSYWKSEYRDIAENKPDDIAIGLAKPMKMPPWGSPWSMV